MTGLSSALSSAGGEATTSYLQRLATLRAGQQREQLDDPLQQAVVLSSWNGVDTATISPAAREAAAAEHRHDGTHQHDPNERRASDEGEAEMLDLLSSRDREVRAHEAAHQAAAGGLAVSGPSYTYQTGPDGKRYAIGGEVQIRLSEGRTPEETLRNMEQAMRAANAPDSPSGPDRAVASAAARIAQKARRELAAERASEAVAVAARLGGPGTGSAVSGGGGNVRPPRTRVDVIA